MCEVPRLDVLLIEYVLHTLDGSTEMKSTECEWVLLADELSTVRRHWLLNPRVQEYKTLGIKRLKVV